MRARARVYPFAFALAVEYRLSADALAIAIEVANPGAAPRALRLRAASGLPLAARRGGARGRVCPVRAGGAARGSAHRAGRAHRQDHASDSAPRPRPAAHRRACSPTTRSASSTARAGRSPSSTPPARRSRWSFPSFPHAALWTRPGAPFLCLEAWTGYSDPDGFEGDLIDKPGMRALEPGTRARHEARFVFRPE